MQRLLVIGSFACALLVAAGAETLPPKPAAYFKDAAGVVSATTAQQLDEKLRQFERDTSNQIVVAIYPTLDTASSVQDYTFRLAQSWQVGQAGKNNGAVLFVFTGPRQMFIQVGYGLEGALPDILCKQIIENEIKPGFKAGNFDAGLTAGVEAMIKATRGEYRGTGQVRGGKSFPEQYGALTLLVVFALIFGLIVISTIAQSWRSGVVYSRGGRSFTAGFLLSLLSNVASAVSSGSSGSSSGGGSSGGFSGGGGSFGGGGAGGSW